MTAKNIGQRLRASKPELMQNGQTQQVLELLLGSVNDLVWCKSADRDELLFLNAVAEGIYGRPLEQLRSDPDVWREAIHPDDKAAVESGLPMFPWHEQIGVQEQIDVQEHIEREYRIV